MIPKRLRILPPYPPVVVALDEPWNSAKIWVDRLKGRVWGFKVGSILFAERGPTVVEEILNSGARVFLDLKYHDIPNTVQLSVRRAVSWGVSLITVHAWGGHAMLKAAAAEQKPDQRVVAVTVLTSLDQEDLKQAGVLGDLEGQVQRLATLAINSGIAGLVSSPHEVADLRERFPEATLVTPGIRLDPGTDDQKRTLGIDETLRAGSDLAVVGRVLTMATDWEKQWERITSSTAGMS